MGEVKLFLKKKKDETGKNNFPIMPRMKKCPGKSLLAKSTGLFTITMGINEFKEAAKASS